MENLSKQISAAKAQHVRTIGEILREIGRLCPKAGELVEQDLENPEMSLERCGKALYDYASKNRTGNSFACAVFGIDPENAVIRLILDFYKIPPEWLANNEPTEPKRAETGVPAVQIDLMELL